MEPGEAGRLVFVAVGCGLLGAMLGTYLGRSDGERSLAQPVVDIAPLADAIRDLRAELRREPLATPLPARAEVGRVSTPNPVLEPGDRDGREPTTSNAPIERFLAALQDATQRLGKLAEEGHRSAQLVDMLQAMSSIQRAPQRVDVVARMAQMGLEAGRELLYLSSAQVVERLGSPVTAASNPTEGTVSWSYILPGGAYVNINFFGNRVVNADGSTR